MFFRHLQECEWTIWWSAFSATEDAFKAAVVSVARGFVLILGAVFVMSAFFGMTGVWLAYAVAEGITTFIMLVMVLRV